LTYCAALGAGGALDLSVAKAITSLLANLAPAVAIAKVVFQRIRKTKTE